MTHRQIMEALTGLLAAFFTAILSSTIVANALPTIMSELKGTQTDFAWVITAALLANAATTPIWGKLADLFDKKVLVQLSIVIFVAGSVMAGLSETIPLLLTARVIQGIAMGGLTALAQAIIGSMIPPRDRGKYSGYMGGVMAVGTAGGPLLGGFIVDSPLGWRWTFFVCVPLAVVALILLQVTLKIQHVKRPAKIDWLGSILLTSGVSLLLIWVSFAGNPDYYDWWSWQSVAMVGGGVLLLAPAGAGGIPGGAAHHPAQDHLGADHRPRNPRLGGRRRGHVRLLDVPWPVLPGGTRRHAHRSRPPHPAHDRRQPDRFGRLRACSSAAPANGSGTWSPAPSC